MGGHLKYAASEYEQEADERGIRPISAVDTEIIMEVMTICQLQGLTKLGKILEKWKAVDDQRMLEFMMAYGEGIGEDFDDDDEDQEGRVIPGFTDFVEIGDEIFTAHDIFRVQRSEHYIKDRIEYHITINGVDESITSIKGVKILNVIIPFHSEDQCNKEFEALKTKMKEFRNCRFL